MEWLRSCYRSTWRLFRSSDVTTEGRYYFSAPGTPHYPGFHNFGSRNWTSDERDAAPQLGELSGAPRPWDRGDFPPRTAPAVLLGSADCVRLGDIFPLPVLSPPRSLSCGIDSRCWIVAGLPVPICVHVDFTGGNGEAGTFYAVPRYPTVAVGGDVQNGTAIGWPSGPPLNVVGGNVEGGFATGALVPQTFIGGNRQGGSSTDAGRTYTTSALGGEKQNGTSDGFTETMT